MWQVDMQSACVTQVYFSHSMQNSQVLECAEEFMSLLRKQCATRSCALSIDGQQTAGGMHEVTCHTLLSKEEVFAFLASAKLKTSKDCYLAVDSVVPQALPNSSAVMLQLRLLQTNIGN